MPLEAEVDAVNARLSEVKWLLREAVPCQTSVCDRALRVGKTVARPLGRTTNPGPAESSLYSCLCCGLLGRSVKEP